LFYGSINERSIIYDSKEDMLQLKKAWEEEQRKID
jgi:hypothetical protein